MSASMFLKCGTGMLLNIDLELLTIAHVERQLERDQSGHRLLARRNGNVGDITNRAANRICIDLRKLLWSSSKSACRGENLVRVPVRTKNTRLRIARKIVPANNQFIELPTSFGLRRRRQRRRGELGNLRRFQQYRVLHCV